MFYSYRYRTRYHLFSSLNRTHSHHHLCHSPGHHRRRSSVWTWSHNCLSTRPLTPPATRGTVLDRSCHVTPDWWKNSALCRAQLWSRWVWSWQFCLWICSGCLLTWLTTIFLKIFKIFKLINCGEMSSVDIITIR